MARKSDSDEIIKSILTEIALILNFGFIFFVLAMNGKVDYLTKAVASLTEENFLLKGGKNPVQTKSGGETRAGDDGEKGSDEPKLDGGTACFRKGTRNPNTFYFHSSKKNEISLRFNSDVNVFTQYDINSKSYISKPEIKEMQEKYKIPVSSSEYVILKDIDVTNFVRDVKDWERKLAGCKLYFGVAGDRIKKEKSNFIDKNISIDGNFIENIIK